MTSARAQEVWITLGALILLVVVCYAAGRQDGENEQIRRCVAQVAAS